MHFSFRRVLGFMAFAAAVVGCSSGTGYSGPIGDGGADATTGLGAGDGGSSGSVAVVCEPGTGKARGPTQSCCLEYGVDACGPMLVCAALDGRTVAACYPEKSRKYGETCTTDAICSTGHCNTSTGKCDGGPGCAPCDMTLTCRFETFLQCLDEQAFEDGPPPMQVQTLTVKMKPNGGSGGQCVLEKDPSSSRELLMCSDEKPSTPWRVIDDAKGRRLVVARSNYAMGTGQCGGTYRYVCPLP